MVETRNVGTSLEEASARAAESEAPDPDQMFRDSELPSSGTFAAEDFLFHLYRGSELLQDNRVREAKEELERALSFQPRDSEGQGLLGVVYFRLGMYPRAIAIYEEIVRARPDDITPRLNLGLCYLKTGQHLLAKESLEEVIRKRSDHARAWGYLGLVYERVGEFEKALAAFERAGQPNMARRMAKVIADLAAPAELRPDLGEVRQVAAEAMNELDDDPRAFSRDAAGGPPDVPGRWHSVELGEEPLPPASRPLRPRALGASESEPAEAPDGPALSLSAPALAPPLTSPRKLAERLVLGVAPGARVSRRTTEVALVRLAGPMAVRLDHVRALVPESGNFKSSPIYRRTRGRDLEEPLGGMRAPLSMIEGGGALVLSASPRLLVTLLEKEFLYAREDRLIAFDLSLRHESGRLAIGSVEHVPMVQLSGEGLAAVRASPALYAVQVGLERGTLLRGSDVVGWIGRLLPQAVAPADAPGSAVGFVAFTGEGSVFLDPG